MDLQATSLHKGMKHKGLQTEKRSKTNVLSDSRCYDETKKRMPLQTALIEKLANEIQTKGSRRMAEEQGVGLTQDKHKSQNRQIFETRVQKSRFLAKKI